MNIREIAEQDLVDTLEDYISGYGLPVELTSPDGEVQIYSKNDPALLLSGQVLFDTTRENPETGERVVIPDPVVSLRITSLDRVPLPGEDWFIRIPSESKVGATKDSYLIRDLAVESGKSIGFIRLYLTKPEQSA